MTKELFLISCFLMAACMEVKDKDESKITDLPKDQSVSQSDSKSTILLTGLQPNRYQVLISSSNNKETSVIKKHMNKEFVIPFNSQRKVSDSDLTAGEEVEYTTGYWDGNNFKTINRFKLSVPVDLVIDNEFTSKNSNWKLTAFNRIFFQENISLLTNGLSLHIKAKEIHFNKNKIETFAPQQKATFNINGRDGGEINLEAETITGEVKIYLQGEAGGDGSAGAAHSARAAKGAKGGKAEFNSQFAGTDITYTCVKPPQNGLPGSNGAKGHPGQPGKRGGNSGSLLVKTLSHDFKPEVYKTPGAPGYGGAGGPGQLGGLGGDPGDNIVYGIVTNACKNAMTGPEGATGPYGDRGSDGYPGSIQSECYFVGAEKICK